MKIVEQPVYGTQRIGIYNRHASPDVYDYELSDYLGNVRAVISAGAGNTITIQSYADYAFENQLKKDGLKSILKSQNRIQIKLVEHIKKLNDIKNMEGGFSSSVEREIRTFKAQLQAIDDLLNK